MKYYLGLKKFWLCRLSRDTEFVRNLRCGAPPGLSPAEKDFYIDAFKYSCSLVTACKQRFSKLPFKWLRAKICSSTLNNKVEIGFDNETLSRLGFHPAQLGYKILGLLIQLLYLRPREH